MPANISLTFSIHASLCTFATPPQSNRASCRGCKGKIAEAVLRVAEMVQSPHFDGLMPMVSLRSPGISYNPALTDFVVFHLACTRCKWYHFRCFFNKRRNAIPTAESIEGFSSLRYGSRWLVLTIVRAPHPAGARWPCQRPCG